VYGQYPFAITLSCIDSRTSVELIFAQGLGNVCSVWVAGNMVNDDILGSIEFACKLAGSKLIIILGYSHYGGIKGAYDDVHLEHLTGLLQKSNHQSNQYVCKKMNQWVVTWCNR